MEAASGKGCPSRRPLARGTLLPSAPCCPRCPAAARRGRARWPGSIRFLALPEPDSWVCDLGEERLWTWWCGGGSGGGAGTGGFRPRTRQGPVPQLHSVKSGLQSIAWAVLTQSCRLFSYLECCWELGFRFFCLWEWQELYSWGVGGKKKRPRFKEVCISDCKMNQGPRNLLHFL